ncbi:MAG: division/cell wall cluster transcriptional repressor MraZ [Ferruginibacter sp.]|nr:division/cell wall cluster transcriptional repressor MraZ [Cytophagales bacterium]
MFIFSGEHECKLDPKGRLMLPSKLKNALPLESANSLVIQHGFEPHLVLYPLPEWQKFYSKIMALNEFNEEHRILQRNFMRSSGEVELDSAGRLLIPKSMQKYAQVDKDVTVIGVGNRIEIWNPTLYDQAIIKSSSQLSHMVAKHMGKDKADSSQMALF